MKLWATPEDTILYGHAVTIDSRRGETGLETMTFSDVGETSPGYGHVIDHTHRARGYARDYHAISSHGCPD